MERTDKVVREAKLALSVEGTAHTAGFAGFDGATFTNAPNAGAVFVTLKPFEERVAEGITKDHILTDLRQAGLDAGGVHPGHQPAAGARRRHRRRLQDVCRGPARPRPGGAGGRDQRAGRAGQPGARSDLGVHAVQHAHAQGLCRHRPRQGRDAGRAGEQRVRHAQRLSGLILRQRLQLSRPHLPRAGQADGEVPPRCRDIANLKTRNARGDMVPWARSPPSGT